LFGGECKGMFGVGHLRNDGWFNELLNRNANITANTAMMYLLYLLEIDPTICYVSQQEIPGGSYVP